MIGCGAIALAVHLPTLVALPGVAVVSVADPLAAAREAAMQVARNARPFESADALLAAGEVDAVVLAMPSSQHAVTAVAALQAGCHVYVEKPVATSARDARRLLDVWQRSSRLGIVGFNYRQHPLVLQARALLQEGAIGDVIAVQTVFSSRPAVVPVWKQHAASGGALFDKGAHHVDLAAFLLGAYPDVVRARTSSRRTAGDTAVFDAEFLNGVCMQSVFSFDGVAEDRFTVIGRTGRLSYDRLAGVTVERSHGPADRAVFKRARAGVGRVARTVRAHAPASRRCRAVVSSRTRPVRRRRACVAGAACRHGGTRRVAHGGRRRALPRGAVGGGRGGGRGHAGSGARYRHRYGSGRWINRDVFSSWMITRRCTAGPRS